MGDSMRGFFDLVGYLAENHPTETYVVLGVAVVGAGIYGGVRALRGFSQLYRGFNADDTGRETSEGNEGSVLSVIRREFDEIIADDTGERIRGSPLEPFLDD